MGEISPSLLVSSTQFDPHWEIFGEGRMASGGINDAGAFMQGEAICCVASSCTKAGRDSLMFDDGLGPDVDAPADRIRDPAMLTRRAAP